MPRAFEGKSLVFVERTGDWARARSTFDGLAFRLRRAGEALPRVVAQETARRIKTNIRQRTYERLAGGDYPALADATVERKASDPRVSVPERTWVEHGELVDAIEAFHLGRGVWAVGIKPDQYGTDEHGEKDDIPLDKIGAMLEWGYDPLHIPQRPVFRIEAERMRSDAATLGTIRSAFALVLANPGAFAGNPFPDSPSGEE